MKYLFSIACLLLVLATTADAQNNVKWMSWEEAMTAAETSPKKIYIDVYTDWCGYCKKMDKTTFKDPKVVDFLNDNFYPVKFNAEQKEKINFNNTEFGYIAGGQRGVHELAYALLNGRLGYPAFVILDEEFARILISPGFKGPDAVMMEMEFAKDEKYKTMAWTNFQTEYKAKLNAASNQTTGANANGTKPNPNVNVKQAANKTNVNAKPINKTKVNTRSTNAKTDTIPRRGGTPPPPPPPPPPPTGEEIYKVVEDMPRFSGCEDKGLSKSEVKQCAENLMLDYIYTNLKYPKTALENKTVGMVVLQFVIDKKGVVKDSKLVRNIGDGCGEAALAIVDAMPDWIPGKQRGKPMNVLYTLPIRFQLDEEGNVKEYIPKSNKGTEGSGTEKSTSGQVRTSTPPPPPPPPPAEEQIFKVVEKMPRFPGCEDKGLSTAEATKCGEDLMLQYIYNNLKYPRAARANKTEGMVVMQFTVDEKGAVRNSKIVRDIGDGCGEAAQNLVNSMPNWIPGMQRGKPVKVLYTLPIRFKLENKDDKEKK